MAQTYQAKDGITFASHSPIAHLTLFTREDAEFADIGSAVHRVDMRKIEDNLRKIEKNTRKI